MTTRDRPLEPLLTAELDELAGKADTDLARRVRGDPRFSAAARKILAANSALDAALAISATSTASTASAASRATNAPALIARARSSERSRASGRRMQWPVIPGAWLWTAATVGTLAVWAIMVVFAWRTTSPADPESRPEVAAEHAEPSVHAPGYSVAVIPTSNPDITIIWLTKESDDGQHADAIRDGPIAVGPDGL